MKPLSIALCLFVAAACGWLALMENVLKHPGYVGRAAIDLCLTAQALATSVCLSMNPSPAIRSTVAASATVAIGLGGFAVRTILRSERFEGYILVIGSAMVLQGVFTLATALRMRGNRAA